MCAAETYTILIVFGYPYQGAGKRPAAQLKNSDALGPKGREQLNKPADAARFFFFFFFFFPASTI